MALAEYSLQICEEKPRNTEITHKEIHSWKEDLLCHSGRESDRKVTNG